ncbi:MAG TPA: polyamine ABC transporter substrate-binding protein [Rhizobiaceae bacterium]|nr:polyamine ABC transporter substrate-binding protein [Rhizobiaceae bacterium]
MKFKIALLATSMLAFSAGAALPAEVRVYNWSDYIDETILQDFEKETGIKVIYDVFDSNEVVETKLLAGSTGYDIVVPSAEFLGRQIQAGVFQQLDKSKLTNLPNMWDDIEAQVAKYDPDNAYSVNYMWGTTGIGFNVGKVKEILGTDTIDSWSVIFDPAIIAKFKDCGVQLLDTPNELLTAALNYLGIDPNTTNPDDLAKGEQALMAIRPFVQKFHSSEYINALANGDICLAVGYSGDVLQAAARAEEAAQGVEIGYSIPKEGALLWFDQMAIPADAQNVDEAHQFINYMMRPEVIAKATNYVAYANGNKASQPLIDPEVFSDQRIYPNEETTKKLYVKLPYAPAANRVVTRIWTRVVTGQ